MMLRGFMGWYVDKYVCSFGVVLSLSQSKPYVDGVTIIKNPYLDFLH